LNFGLVVDQLLLTLFFESGFTPELFVNFSLKFLVFPPIGPFPPPRPLFLSFQVEGNFSHFSCFSPLLQTISLSLVR